MGAQKPVTKINPTWHFDSGCGKHMTGDKANLINYRNCSDGPKIMFAGGELNPTLGIGDVKIGKLTIKDVLHVQGLQYNLFSMSQFADKGFSVKIKSKECKLIDNESKQVVLVARRKGSLYVADWASATTETCLMVSQSGHTEKVWLWHKRMSHVNFKSISKLAKKGLVIGLPDMAYKKDGICSACQLGK